MADIDDFLKEAQSNSPFIKFIEGEPVTGKFIKAEIIEDKFNKGDNTMQYTLEVDGEAKTFTSKSVKLASQMKKYMDKEVELVKTGESFKTIWYVGEPSK
jgi:hypothetical protein